MRSRACILGLALVALAVPSAASASVDYGPISHSGLKNKGAASTGLKLALQIGFKANQSGIANAVKSASNPSSSHYGHYLSLSNLASTYGAPKSERNGVVNAFKNVGITATVDVTHLRASATISINKAQKFFGTKWDLYSTDTKNQYVALPVNTPKLPSGVKGNVDTVAGMRLTVTQGSSGSSSSIVKSPQPRIAAHTRAVTVDGGTPTRTGTIAAGCTPASFPQAAYSTEGLFPNEILTAYGVAGLHSEGLLGQGSRVAIVGEAPTVSNDLSTFRSCFGFPGTALSTHHAGSIQPILESSLDTQVVAMTAPQLSRLDLWVHPLNEDDDDGDVEGFLELLAQPLQATTNGTPLPQVISVSYGVCEATVKPYTASLTLANRQLAATAALGITTVVAAGDAGSSSCAHGVPSNQLTSAEKQQSPSWPATSPYVLAAGGTNLALTSSNAIASSGVWNDTQYASPYQQAAGGGGGTSTFESRPWWQPAYNGQSKHRMVPDLAAFADPAPGYLVVCSKNVQSCGASSSGQRITFVGGTSAAAPLVAGMIALWDQQARQAGLPKPGFVPPLLYALAKQVPSTFYDISLGNDIIFSGNSCCNAGPGFDKATGLGSPRAAQITANLHG